MPNNNTPSLEEVISNINNLDEFFDIFWTRARARNFDANQLFNAIADKLPTLVTNFVSLSSLLDMGRMNDQQKKDLWTRLSAGNRLADLIKSSDLSTLLQIVKKSTWCGREQYIDILQIAKEQWDTVKFSQ